MLGEVFMSSRTYKEYCVSGKVYKHWFNHEGKRHREDGPAYIEYSSDGSVQWEDFYINDQLHRKDGPAETLYDSDGSVKNEWFHIHGMCLGYDRVGFWNLWNSLSEKEREHPNILKLLLRYL
jgi:uncharacterized protein YodC (DUF2158 family)